MRPDPSPESPSGTPGTGAGVRTGCDVQSVEDVEIALRDFGSRYLQRIYTPEEQLSLDAGGAASLAARFAAKEAVLKILGDAQVDGAGIGGVDLRTVEIARGAHGRPVVHLHDRAAALADAAGVRSIDVSLSHSGGLALAVAVAVADPGRRTSPEGA